MSFRNTNQRYLAPAAQGLMIFGIVSLCQPWSLLLHQYGATLTLVGLITFMITSKIAPDPEPEADLFDESMDMLEINEDAPNDTRRKDGYKDGGIV